MEHVAYSWFNRLCAIRYMEQGFLDHGRRVLSAADDAQGSANVAGGRTLGATGSAGVSQILERVS